MVARFLGVLLIATLLQFCLNFSVDAQAPSDEQLDQAARITFMQGREAFNQANYELALERFKQAYDMSHRPQLLFNIGTALDRLDRDAEAIKVFEQYLAEVPDAQDRVDVERRISIKKASVAKQKAEQEAAKEREAELVAAKAEQARLERERKALEEKMRNNATVDAPKKKKGLPPLAFIAVASAAVVMGGVGIATGLVTRGRNNDYLADNNPLTVQESYDSARSMQTITNVMFIGAGVLGAAAVVLAILTDWGGKDDKAPSSGAQVSFGPRHLSLGYQGSF